MNKRCAYGQARCGHEGNHPQHDAVLCCDHQCRRQPQSFAEEHLGGVFANIASPGTVANLRRDPRIEINCADIFARRGYRFTGLASVRSGGDPIYEAVRESVRTEHGDAVPVHDVVLIEVLSAKPVLSPAYAYVPGVTEAGLREAYARKYGMAPLPAMEKSQ